MESISKFSTSDEYKLTSSFPNTASVVEDESVRYLIKGANFVAGDIVLWNGVQKVVVAQENYSTTVFPEDKFTPIGVVVIPESHMYDGKARMMSTRWMSCDDPENGSDTIQEMGWGGLVSGLTSFSEVPIIARYDDEEFGGTVPLTEPQEIYTTFKYGFLPSDYPDSWTGENNPEDEGTRWYKTGTYTRQTESGETIVVAYNYYVPSPYAKDGTPNPLYRATSYSGGTINNALSYFDGKQQTELILAARGERDYSSWKLSQYSNDDYPAASCCDMYHTVGTSQGDWYLPSQAELGYVVARLFTIMNATRKLPLFLDIRAATLWSSNLYRPSFPRDMIFHCGLATAYGDNSQVEYFHTIAFATV